MEIFTPPYLYRKDGSGPARRRGRRSSARPRTLGYDGAFTLTSARRPARIRKLALVRLGAPTHSEDQSQRYVPLQLHASPAPRSPRPAPNNPNEAPAGHYMLFAVDAGGVPSHGADRQSVQRRSSPPRRRRVNLALNRPATGTHRLRHRRGAREGRQRLRRRAAGRTSSARRSPAPVTSSVDLGSSRRRSARFVIKHAGAGGEAASMNTRAFNDPDAHDARPAAWSTAVTVTTNTANVSTHPITARAAPATCASTSRSPSRARRPAPPASTSSRPTTARRRRATERPRDPLQRRRPPPAACSASRPARTTSCAATSAIVGNDAGAHARRRRPATPPRSAATPPSPGTCTTLAGRPPRARRDGQLARGQGSCGVANAPPSISSIR